jgi:hypothetical protein
VKEMKNLRGREILETNEIATEMNNTLQEYFYT